VFPFGGRLTRSLVIPALLFGSSLAVASPVRAGDGAAYVPFGPTRFVDSRIGLGIGGTLAAFSPATFPVAGTQGVPADAVAVTGNLTVTNEAGTGYLCLTTTPSAHPGTSTLNFPQGDTRANGVFAALGPGGSLSMTASTRADVVFDVTGYFVNGSGATYFAIAPGRFLDTRRGTGLSGRFVPNVPRTLQIAGVGGIPGGATAITGNVVVDAPNTGGHVAVTRYPVAAPTTSTLNFPAGDVRANNFTVPLAPDGSIGITFVGYSPGVTTDVVLDVTGYFVPGDAGARYIPIAPVRSADSRYDNGLNGPISSGSPVTLQVGGRVGVPDGVQAITANLTAVAGAFAGYAAITPIATSTPSTSSLNFPAHDIRPNGFVSPLSSAGTLGLAFNGSGTADFVVDVTGYFVGGSVPATVGPPPFSGMSLYRYSAWSRQATSTWCIGASTQMMLNIVTGASDHSGASQSTYMSFAFSNSRYVARVGAEVDGWAAALTYFGAGAYGAAGYGTAYAAVKAAVTRMRVTGKPVGLVVMEGHHAWVMAGFTSVGDDPSVSQNFTVTSVTAMAPLYPSMAYDPAPGSAESMEYMAARLTPYTDDYPTIWDGEYVIIQP
jgi:hypothetical protein